MDVALTVQRHKSWVITAAAVAPVLTCAALSTFRDSITATTAVLVLVLLVVGAASTGVRVAGVVAAISGALSFDFFLTQPYQTLNINDGDDIEAAILLVLIGVAVTEVALWGHRQQVRANRRAGYLDGVLGTAEIVTLQQASPDTLVHHVEDQIRQILGVGQCRFVAGPVRDSRTPRLDHQGLVWRGDHQVNVERDGLPTDDNVALVVTRADVPLGHFLLTAAADIARPTLEQRKVAVLLADQAGSALADPTG